MEWRNRGWNGGQRYKHQRTIANIWILTSYFECSFMKLQPKAKEEFQFFCRNFMGVLAFLPLIWSFVVNWLKTHSDKKCRTWSYLDQVLCHSRHAGAAAMPKWDADCQKINAKYALTKDYMSFKQAMDVLPLRNWVSFKAWPKIITAGFAQRHS